MNPDLFVAQTPLLVLNVVRAMGFFATAPLFGIQRESRMLRVVLGLVLGMTFWYVETDWTTQLVAPLAPDRLTDLGILAFREALVGMVCGFSLHAILSILGIAGEIIAHEMGFSLSRILNPVTGSQSSSMSQFFEVMAYLLIFQMDMHHEFVRSLHSTYEFLPVGQAFDFTVVWTNLQVMISGSINLGLRYAAPIFGVMLLLTVTLVILARAVQNINLLEFSFSLRILLALFASIYFLSEGQPFLIAAFESIFDQSKSLFAGA